MHSGPRTPSPQPRSRPLQPLSREARQELDVPIHHGLHAPPPAHDRVWRSAHAHHGERNRVRHHSAQVGLAQRAQVLRCLHAEGRVRAHPDMVVPDRQRPRAAGERLYLIGGGAHQVGHYEILHHRAVTQRRAPEAQHHLAVAPGRQETHARQWCGGEPGALERLGREDRETRRGERRLGTSRDGTDHGHDQRPGKDTTQPGWHAVRYQVSPARVSRNGRSCTLPERFQYLAARQPANAAGHGAASHYGDIVYEGDVSWFGDDSRGSSIPTPQALLRSVYVGRVCVAVAIYLAAALKFAVAAPLDLLVTSFVLVATVVVTGASYWHTHFRRRSPGRTFLYGQALFDVALITAVVHITGGPQSDLTPLYVPLIAVTAVLMPPASTGLITALVGIVYFADVFFGHRTPMTGQVALQLLVFVGVAAVTAYFASRVSVMGAEREALAGELRQARLEAADVLRNIPTGIVTVDQAGHLLYCNPAAEQILGFKERLWRGRPIMPEFAKIAPEFWAAITATARRGVRAMRVEATVRRPDRTFPIGVTTTTLELEPATEPRVTAI